MCIYIERGVPPESLPVKQKRAIIPKNMKDDIVLLEELEQSRSYFLSRVKGKLLLGPHENKGGKGVAWKVSWPLLEVAWMFDESVLFVL